MRTSLATLCPALVFALACGSTDVGPAGPGGLAYDGSPTANSPYEVELVSNGQTLPTFENGGRFYILGQVGQRYSIRVKNPTAVRIEAIISVDGLDVIDGETANTNKRGYVVMPHSEINVDGFRVSTSQVAAFRFSSVDDSYAGRKGKARNVGVIGVAIFSERAEQPLVLPQDRVSSRDFGGDGDGDDEDAEFEVRGGGENVERGRVGSATDRKIKQSTSRIRRRPAPPTSIDEGAPTTDSDVYRPAEQCCGPRTNRPGLGTEYGERRYSAVGFTRFVRGSTQPTAYAELRYNNAAGLAAIGINTGQPFDEGEVTRRETAEPFPGQRFSQPPR